MSDKPLPELQDTLLDAATLGQLFGDLATHARVLDVLTKGGATERTDGKPIGLDQAQRSLLAGDVRAVQIRYLFDQVEWRDTLMRVPGGIRLVRIQTPIPDVDCEA